MLVSIDRRKVVLDLERISWLPLKPLQRSARPTRCQPKRKRRRSVVERLLASVRLYLCPFAVARAQLGRGFVFVQSENSLAQLALPLPVDCDGRALEVERALLLHYVTMEEYDKELRREEERAVSPEKKTDKTNRHK